MQGWLEHADVQDTFPQSDGRGMHGDKFADDFRPGVDYAREIDVFEPASNPSEAANRCVQRPSFTWRQECVLQLAVTPHGEAVAGSGQGRKSAQLERVEPEHSDFNRQQETESD